MTPNSTTEKYFNDAGAQTPLELSRLCAMSMSELEQTAQGSPYVSIKTLPHSPRSERKHMALPGRGTKRRLAVDLDLDIFTATLLLSNFRRIEKLEREVYALGILVRSRYIEVP